MDNCKKDTIMAFVRLACTLIASAAAMAGFAIDADALFTGAACAIALVAFIWAWWKNNNVTAAASEAQEILNIMKANSESRRDDNDIWDEDDEVEEELSEEEVEE